MTRRLAIVVVAASLVARCGGDDPIEPIAGEAGRRRIEAIAAADPRVQVSEGVEYDLAGESCDDTYGTLRDAGHQGWGLELGHRPATDEEVEELVGIIARTAAFCPDYAAEVGESASRALSRVQLGNPDPFTSKHLDEDLGARFVVIADDATSADASSGTSSPDAGSASGTSESVPSTSPDGQSDSTSGGISECLRAWVDGVTAPVRCEEYPDAYTKAIAADLFCSFTARLDEVAIATGLGSCPEVEQMWLRYVEWDGPVSGSSGSAELGDGWMCASTSAAGQIASGGQLGECFNVDHTQYLYTYQG